MYWYEQKIRNVVALWLVCVILVSCGVLSGPKEESPISSGPGGTPTTIPETVHQPVLELRAFLGINPQLSHGIAQMNLLIEICNQQPGLCRQGELILRLDAVNSAIGEALSYADFLQPTPTVRPTP